MSNIPPLELVTQSTVQLLSHMASDNAVINAARVCSDTIGEFAAPDAALENRDIGLIRTLMKHRHGTPFEHTAFTFMVETPIFVAREFMRHRIGFSYNEISGRYATMPSRYYVVGDDRPITPAPGSKPMRPNYVVDALKAVFTRFLSKVAIEMAHETYHTLLADGVPKEVARNVLPVCTMTRFYVTCNARSLMAFLSLRVGSDTARFETYPLHEIDAVAREMERQAAEVMPVTFRLFEELGRVGP